jgi:uncharacterized protein with HEPN domain
MRDFAAEACEFARGRSRVDLDSDRSFMLITTRLLEMMGEAATKLSDETRQQNPQVPWKEVTGLRHHLVHGYFKVNLDMIWCEPTADRSVSKGIYPTPHRYAECLWEPTAAACFGVG